MDVHKPKPIHNWRELLSEIGTIVIGVLIALAAEQTVEAFHWRHKVAEAEEAMRLELRDDDLPQAYARVAITPCMTAALDRVEAALDAGDARAPVTAAVPGYDPPTRTWDMEAWRAAVASDAASHMSAARMTLWSGPYRIMPRLTLETTGEAEARSVLRAGARQAGPLSPAEREAKLLAVEQARTHNRSMFVGSYTLLAGAAKAGVMLAEPSKQATLKAMRDQFGACVVVPRTVTTVDWKDQTLPAFMR